MEDAPSMTLLQAIAVCDEVTPSPATAHQALRRLSRALADALCLPRSALRSYAVELEAAAIEKMPAENEFTIKRLDGDKDLSLAKAPADLPPLQVGLLAKLVGYYDGTPLTVAKIAEEFHDGRINEVRQALVGLQAARYVRYNEDDNTVLVRSML